jgi:hypothetical protein
MTHSQPRSGYTLPVFACAAAIAALKSLISDESDGQPIDSVSLDLLDPPQTREIPIEQVAKLKPDMALAIARSDPGDNLDLTRNTPVWAMVELVKTSPQPTQEHQEHDERSNSTEAPLSKGGLGGLGSNSTEAPLPKGGLGGLGSNSTEAPLPKGGLGGLGSPQILIQGGKELAVMPTATKPQFMAMPDSCYGKIWRGCCQKIPQSPSPLFCPKVGNSPSGLLMNHLELFKVYRC